MSMSIEVLQDRVERCEMELQGALGYIKALEYGLHSVIATRTEEVSLEELWGAILAAQHSWPDQSHSGSLQCAAQHQAMAAITELISERKSS